MTEETTKEVDASEEFFGFVKKNVFRKIRIPENLIIVMLCCIYYPII